MNYQTKVCLFIRCSTEKQDYDRQVLELTDYCNQKGYHITKTIATKISGTKTYKDRPDLIELLEVAKQSLFNKVIVSEISRIGRNAKDIRNTIDILHENKIAIVFRNLGGLESIDENGKESFVTNIIIAIYSELAQEEKRMLSERIKSGLANAVSKGKVIGRKLGAKKDIVRLLNDYGKLAIDIRKGFSLSQCVKLHNVSKNTVLKVKRAIY